MGDTEAAYDALTQFVAANPANGKAQLYLGYYAVLLGRPETAVSQLRLAEKLLEDDEYANLAILVYSYGRLGLDSGAERF